MRTQIPLSFLLLDNDYDGNDFVLSFVELPGHILCPLSFQYKLDNIRPSSHDVGYLLALYICVTSTIIFVTVIHRSTRSKLLSFPTLFACGTAVLRLFHATMGDNPVVRMPHYCPHISRWVLPIDTIDPVCTLSAINPWNIRGSVTQTVLFCTVQNSGYLFYNQEWRVTNNTL